MSRQHRRGIVTVVIAGLMMLAPALTHGAVAAPADPGTTVADTTACAQPTDGYAPRGACQLLVQQAQSACVGGAPVLEYAVQAEGTPNTTVTLTWQNPTGPDVIYAGLPLSGRVLWPGTVIENGTVVDWPGWTRQADGSFTPGDEYDWVRPSVHLLFEVNPSTTAVVVYPPESALCSDPTVILDPDGGADPVAPVDPSLVQPTYRSAVLAAGSTDVTAGTRPFRSGVLAATGIDPSPEVRIAVGLIGGGLLVLIATRLISRRRARVED